MLSGKGMMGGHGDQPKSLGGAWIPVKTEGGGLSHMVGFRKKGLLALPVHRWFEEHRVFWLQPRPWGTRFLSTFLEVLVELPYL